MHIINIKIKTLKEWGILKTMLLIFLKIKYVKGGYNNYITH